MSTARTAHLRLHRFADGLVDLLDRPPRRRSVREELLVDVVERDSALASHDDVVVLDVPLEDGARAEPESASNPKKYEKFGSW